MLVTFFKALFVYLVELFSEIFSVNKHKTGARINGELADVPVYHIKSLKTLSQPQHFAKSFKRFSYILSLVMK